MGGTIVEQRNPQGVITKEYFDQGFEQSRKSYFYGRDHLGSVHNLTDSTATIQTQIDYGLYGEVTGLTGTTIPDFGYTSLFYHQRSGLNFAEFRVYDSGVKRWLNRDPIGELGGINLYGYGGNGPLTRVDPSGNQYAGHGGFPVPPPNQLPPGQGPGTGPGMVTHNPDGSTTVVDPYNGTQTTTYPNGTKVVYDQSDGTTTTTYPDGTVVIQYPNGETQTFRRLSQIQPQIQPRPQTQL